MPTETAQEEGGHDVEDLSQKPVLYYYDDPMIKLRLSFFLFGLINNVLYVVILSAALDLVPPSTPKGIIAFCNIAPALIAKVGWPYVLKGRIRYAKRLLGCCFLAVAGMIVVALFESLFMRLVGIMFASFASGLGELTFLQLSTTYHPPSIGGHAVGYFASGTGAAGLVGAFLWWEVRGLGVRTGVALSAVLPFVIPVAYFLLLPRAGAFAAAAELHPDVYAEEQLLASSVASYAPLATADADADADAFEEPEAGLDGADAGGTPVPVHVTLSGSDKWRLVKPLLVKYMLPLFCVYTFEYTINQGVAPTLLYPVPDPVAHPILGSIIHSIRDYYPLWQLVYQSTVFLSRSSISLGLPPLPARLIAFPAVLQAAILLLVAGESARGIFAADDDEGTAIFWVFCLIGLEGICGGLAYVNVFYRVNQERGAPPAYEGSAQTEHERERAKQEREFRIGSIGFADSLGILLASVLAVPTEVALCRAQVTRGRTLCRTL